MATSTNNDICSGITPIIEQKQRFALFNKPPIRLNVVSPSFSQFSQFRLNMRRKTEILKYENNQQNTKTNNLTKKQSYSYLVNNPPKRTTNTLVNDTCAIKPTSTTACDIPGQPIIIQYEPSVPLYNYGNFKENRPYAIINSIDDTTFKYYTKNIIEYLEELLYIVTPDLSLSYQTYVVPIGSLIIGQNSKIITFPFSLSIPIAFWFSGSLKCGYDSSDNLIVKPNITNSDILTFHITKISLNILYNNSIVQPLTTPFLNNSLIDCSFHLNVLQPYKQFYAIQYIGMLQIDNLTLQTPINTIYDITVDFNYTYNNTTAYKLDYLQTGIFANIQSATSPNYLFRCSLDSVTPSDFSVGSFTRL